VVDILIEAVVGIEVTTIMDISTTTTNAEVVTEVVGEAIEEEEEEKKEAECRLGEGFEVALINFIISSLAVQEVTAV
jgi:hypothetical protein